MKLKRIMPTTYLLISIVLMVLLHLFLPIRIIIPRTWHYLGIIPLVLGVVLNLVADRAFHREGTTVKPFDASTVLVTEGAFAVTRHPMYLGFLLLLAGLAILFRSVTPWFVIVAYGIWLERVYVSVEEEMLAEQFGQEWDLYRQSTRRWI